MDLVGFLRDWRRVGKAEMDMEVGAEVMEAKEEEEEKKEKEDTKIGVAEKKSTIVMLGIGLLLLFRGL